MLQALKLIVSSRIAVFLFANIFKYGLQTLKSELSASNEFKMTKNNLIHLHYGKGKIVMNFLISYLMMPVLLL